MPKRKNSRPKDTRNRVAKKAAATRKRKVSAARAALTRTRKKARATRVPSRQDALAPAPPTLDMPGMKEGTLKPGPSELIEGVGLPSDPSS